MGVHAEFQNAYSELKEICITLVKPAIFHLEITAMYQCPNSLEGDRDRLRFMRYLQGDCAFNMAPACLHFPIGYLNASYGALSLADETAPGSFQGFPSLLAKSRKAWLFIQRTGQEPCNHRCSDSSKCSNDCR